MMIPEDKVEEVKAATDIVDVVSDYVRLKKAGTNFKGLCPFHNEKTPSFNVNPAMGIFKCFGCGEGGDAISFVMKVEGLGFTETVRMLAEQAGIELPAEGERDPHSDEKEAILHALRFAARWYYEQLTRTDEGKRRGLGYFESRGLSPETIKKFGLGYAPGAWDGLLTAATAAQISPDILDKAGLVLPNKNGDGFHDRFRERAMFPILSHVGKVLGFGGRVLPDSTPPTGDYVPPKYINSPETRVYSKSRVLYGMYQSKNAIRQSNLAVLVEGYTDLISMYQAGINNVVATSGTALTSGQVAMIGRYASRILMIYDADNAGVSASLKSTNLIHQNGLRAYIVELPKGMDPDQFAQKSGQVGFEKYVDENKKDIVTFRSELAQRNGELDDPATRVELIRELVETVSYVRDSILRDHYITYIGSAFGVPDMPLFKQLDVELTRRRKGDAAEQIEKTNWQSKPVRAPRREMPPLPENEYEPSAGPAPAPETFEMKPEEGALLRLMLEHGRPMVEHVLGHMALDEFSTGPVRRTVEQLLAQYQEGQIDAEAFTGGQFGPVVQQVTAGVLVDRHVASDNYARKGMRVPEMNAEPYEAAASAMTLLKLDRVNEAIALANRRTYAAEQAGDDLTPLQQQMQELQRLRIQIERREFFEWGKASAPEESP